MPEDQFTRITQLIGANIGGIFSLKYFLNTNFTFYGRMLQNTQRNITWFELDSITNKNT